MNNNQNDFRPEEPYEYNYAPNQAPQGVAPQPAAQTESSGLAVGSLVCGIIGILCCCLQLPLGIVSVVLAIVDRAKTKKFSGMAIAGLICGIVAVVIGIAVLMIYVKILTDADFIKQYYYGTENPLFF